MKHHPLNWQFYQYFFHLDGLPKSPKNRAAYYVISLILVIFGSWLILFMLGLQGFHPFNPQMVSPHEDQLLAGFSPSVIYWSEEIITWSDAWDLDPLLVATVMQIESCGNPSAVSPAGAQGLFQVMPYHFEQNENALDPETNARRGLQYLSQSHTLSDGKITLTLAGYNGGHGQITRDKSVWPGETQRYADWGAAIYAEVQEQKNPSKTLTNWLEAGGWQLCQQAEEVLNLQ